MYTSHIYMDRYSCCHSLSQSFFLFYLSFGLSFILFEISSLFFLHIFSVYIVYVLYECEYEYGSQLALVKATMTIVTHALHSVKCITSRTHFDLVVDFYFHIHVAGCLTQNPLFSLNCTSCAICLRCCSYCCCNVLVMLSISIFLHFAELRATKTTIDSRDARFFGFIF